MTDRDAVARFPATALPVLQASSYNRASTNRNQPDQGTGGWFADSDGLGFIRTETINGRTEWVLMEHDGPGCITKIWTPFFYYGFNDRVGPERPHLPRWRGDAGDRRVADQARARRKARSGRRFATPTARAGNLLSADSVRQELQGDDGQEAVLQHHQLPRLSGGTEGGDLHPRRLRGGGGGTGESGPRP